MPRAKSCSSPRASKPSIRGAIAIRCSRRAIPNSTVPKADLIVAIGAHIDVFSTTFKYGIFNEQAKLVHHTAAPGQIGIVFPVTVGVAGSTRSFIAGLRE